MKTEITLRPINNRFKRLIAEFGNEWIIIHGPNMMHCFNGEIGVCCHPKNNNQKFSNFKWKDVG